MFIQVIRGQATDREGLRRQMDRWNSELRPGAAGFLGSTAGITDDGRFVAMARFESEAASRANSQRDEQGAWWAETEKCLEAASFQDSTEVITMQGGGSNDAGFVQVMCGRVTDTERMAALRPKMGEVESAMKRYRPDVLGDVIAVNADDSYTDLVYFQSEAEAREGETKEMPAELGALFGELMAAIAVDEYLDLKDPWLT
jgi:hypothetical protein